MVISRAEEQTNRGETKKEQRGSAYQAFALYVRSIVVSHKYNKKIVMDI
jgi:hypothetical protein